MLNTIYQTWPWWLSGGLIAFIMFLLLFFGQSFGFSSNLRTICAAAGCGKSVSFFDFNWRSQLWNIVFLVGAILGGYIAHEFLSNDEPIKIASTTIQDLAELGFAEPTSVQPPELFSIESVLTLNGFLILALGGLLVGFGSRYAGGCTSGHAISGLANLQFPSLLAVIGFFIGGLIMTFLIFPILFSL